MKVIMVNGSPNEKGCTFTAMEAMIQVYEEKGISASERFIGDYTNFIR